MSTDRKPNSNQIRAAHYIRAWCSDILFPPLTLNNLETNSLIYRREVVEMQDMGLINIQPDGTVVPSPDLDSIL